MFLGRYGRPASRCSRCPGGRSHAIRRRRAFRRGCHVHVCAICPGPPSNSCSTLERALRASANGPPGSPGLHLQCLLDEELAGGGRCGGLADHRLKGSRHAPVAVDAHAAGGKVDHDAPARHELAGALLGDPASRSVGAPGKHHLEPAYSRRAGRVADHGQRGLLAGDRPAIGRRAQPEADRGCAAPGGPRAR